MTRVLWAPQAIQDVEAIRAHVARDSAHYADLVVERIVAAVERLKDHPRSGRVVPELCDESIREVIHGLQGCDAKEGAPCELTVLNLVWGPRMCQLPHDHGMWAVIGIYTGREDNIFWRRPACRPGGEAAGARALSDREAVPLGHDIIHSVINPIRGLTGAIHVYGGDFFAVPRSEWDPEHLVEQPYDVEKTLALFEESNRLYPPP